MKEKIKCLLGFHGWSDWNKETGTFYAYRYCIDCGKVELNWRKWIDELPEIKEK